MTDAIRVPDLPEWPEAPFRGAIAARYQIKRTMFQGQDLAVVWDPEHEVYAAGKLVDGNWQKADLDNAMNNLAGATFTKLYGTDGYAKVLRAKQISPAALSAEAKAMLSKYNELYTWGAQDG